MSPERNEIEAKLSRLRELMAGHGLHGILLRRVSSFAWATGGVSSSINTATDVGVGELLVTPTEQFLVTNNIEAPRFEAEDGLVTAGWQLVSGPWHSGGGQVTGKVTGTLGCDAPYPGAVDLSAEIARLRADLLPVECDRFRELGRRCGEAIAAAAERIAVGMTEHQIAALLAEESTTRGVWPIVDLVATDERIHNVRHPLPTDKKLERHAMIVLCGRAWGLVCSVTRFVHFGPLPAELERRQRATAEVDATFVAATRPGASLGDIFAKGVSRYAATGFGHEWQLHHQGGAAGYEPREYLGLPGSKDIVRPGQAYAWNPSITGTKSEDTILVGTDDNEILTATTGWPTLEIEIDGGRLARPLVLVR